jgi:uncharacterized OB-fold protein
LKDTLVSITVLAAILIASALFTSWFARTVYNRCARCGTLNAKRRAACRSCGNSLR